jgi:RNA polymerase sigma-70 factor (ECF subfamily)
MRVTRFQCASDEQTVQAARAGERDAFDELVYRYRGGILLAASQILGSRAAAEDVAQEVFVAAFYSLDQLRDSARFGSWMHAIARNRARRALGDALRTVPSEPAELERLTEHHRTSLARDVQRDMDLAEAVSTLPDDLRTLVLLRYGEQWPVARIAIFLSLPVTTVNWRLHQARKSLKQILLPSKDDEHG